MTKIKCLDCQTTITEETNNEVMCGCGQCRILSKDNKVKIMGDPERINIIQDEEEIPMKDLLIDRYLKQPEDTELSELKKSLYEKVVQEYLLDEETIIRR